MVSDFRQSPGLPQEPAIGGRGSWSFVLVCSTLLAAATYPFTANAQEVQAPVAGGSGGSYFEYSCGPGRMLVGLRGSAGVLVDAVQAVCARVDAAGYVSDARPAGPVFGGSRPFDKAADCPDQQAIQSIRVSQTENQPLIGSIQITCREVARFADGGRTELEIEGSGHLALYASPQLSISSEDRGYYVQSNCPNETYAVGIRGRASQYLDALGLICAPKAAAASVAVDAGFSGLVGQEVSLQASNYPDRFIRHRHSLGYAEPISGQLGRDDSTFRIVPGLAGRCISLQSRNYPGQYLRHQNWRIKLAPSEDNDTYRQDATFCMVPGLASSAGVSFESVNAKGHFIRHRGGELWVDRFDGSDLGRRDATFNVTNPGGVDVR